MSGNRHSGSPAAWPAAQTRREPVVGGEEAADLLAERDLHRAGQRRDVDDDVGLELGDGVGEGVGEDQPALGVGVGDLAGAAAVVA